MIGSKIVTKAFPGLLAAVLMGGCSGEPTPSGPPGPDSSAAPASVPPAASSALSSAVPRASASTASTADAIRLQPAGGPLDHPVVQGVVAAGSGFALVGYGVGEQDPPGFIVRGTTDGQTWTRVSAGQAAPTFTALASGPLGWIATSDEMAGAERRTVIWFSADGIAWQRVPDQAGIAAANLSGAETNPVAAGGAGFAIVGQVTESGSSVAAVWISPDGRTWNEAQPLHGLDIERIVPTDGGFVAASGGCCGGTATAALSADGHVWRDLTTDAGAPFSPDSSAALMTSVRSTLVVVRAGGGGAVEVYAGDLGNAGDGVGIAWRHDPATDSVFAGAGISTATAGPGGALILGFDRRTLAPIAWTSSDGLRWARHALGADRLDGGVPTLAAVGGTGAAPVFIAVADRANDAGDVRPRIWRSTDGAAWSEAGGDVLGVAPAVATGPCPTPAPTVVEDFLAMPPSLWPICFGEATLTVRGVVTECGCGGTTSQQASPAWLIDSLGFAALYLSGPVVPAATGPGGFGVRIDPAHPASIPRPGTIVEARGHFDDPAALSCRVWPLPDAFGPVVPRTQTVALCRQAFVVTAIRTLAG